MSCNKNFDKVINKTSESGNTTENYNEWRYVTCSAYKDYEMGKQDKDEWESFYKSAERGKKLKNGVYCICGTRIMNCYQYYNSENGTFIDVGSECRYKFKTNLFIEKFCKFVREKHNSFPHQLQLKSSEDNVEVGNLSSICYNMNNKVNNLCNINRLENSRNKCGIGKWILWINHYLEVVLVSCPMLLNKYKSSSCLIKFLKRLKKEDGRISAQIENDNKLCIYNAKDVREHLKKLKVFRQSLFKYDPIKKCWYHNIFGNFSLNFERKNDNEIKLCNGGDYYLLRFFLRRFNRNEDNDWNNILLNDSILKILRGVKINYV